MSDDIPRGGPIQSTPEGGPVEAGVPASAPGAGQVQMTPEAGPLTDDRTLSPPTWREHMRGPILGLDDAPRSQPREPASAAEDRSMGDADREPPPQDEPSEEFRKWPPYTGKPVSEARWQEIGRYAAPIASQAEKLAIAGIDLSARGLSRLARYLESRREERERE